MASRSARLSFWLGVQALASCYPDGIRRTGRNRKPATYPIHPQAAYNSKEARATASVEFGGFRDGARSHRLGCKGRCTANGEQPDAR